MALNEQERAEINNLNQAVFRNKKILKPVNFAEKGNLFLNPVGSNEFSVSGDKIDGNTIEQNKRYALFGQTNQGENGIFYGTSNLTIVRTEDFLRFDQINDACFQVSEGSFEQAFFDCFCEEPFILNVSPIFLKINEEYLKSTLKVPRIKITSAKTGYSNNPVNFEMSNVPTHKGIVTFNLQIEENFDPFFLNFRPFIELRMFKSVSNGKYGPQKKNKTKNITSPKSPNGFIYSDVNSKYKSNNNVFSDGYNQICEIPLNLPYLICDPMQGYNFVQNNDLGDYDPVTNMPDISNIYAQKGNYYTISAESYISDFSIGNVKIGDKIIWDGSRIDKIKKNKAGQSSLMRFDFMPHGFFGLASNGIGGTFDFPVRVEDWNNKPEIYRNRRSISSNSGYLLQKKYNFNEQTGNFEGIPNRGKALIVGFRVGVVMPNTNYLYYGEDSLFLKIKPAKTKRNPASDSYYYDWAVEKFVF